MNALSLSEIFSYGLVLSIGGSLILLTSMAINPRIMRSDYPPEIKETIPLLTTPEKRQLAITGLLFYSLWVACFVSATRLLIARNGKEGVFLPVFFNTYLIFALFNLFDLVVLDYLLLIVIKPRFMFIPGVEGMAKYNTFNFHFKGFLKGLVIGVVVSFIVAIVTTIVA